jgi:hypothetical protein
MALLDWASCCWIGPVTDLATAHANQVGKPVAGHVCEEDGLRCLGEQQAWHHPD